MSAVATVLGGSATLGQTLPWSDRLTELGGGPGGLALAGVLVLIAAVAGAFVVLPGKRRRADRVQRGAPFKVGASVLVAALGIGAFVTNWVLAARERQASRDAMGVMLERMGGDAARAQTVQEILGQSGSVASVGVLALAATAVAGGVIWLGAGLTYLSYAIGAAALAGVLAIFGQADLAFVVLGAAGLGMSFVVLMRGLQLVLAGHHPVLAIARNVLAEAVRMKVSLVFIVMLILALAILPGVLDEDQPLRYQVQSFLQWSTGGAFWIIAILTLLFGVSTVSGEQRDKIIWQTVTKPVSAWQYLLGKWVGVAGLAALLLAVSATGIFGFTEYLRAKPALGEQTPYGLTAGGVISEDRLLLETRVLTARESVSFDKPPELRLDHPDFQSLVRQRLERIRVSDTDFAMNARGEPSASAEREFAEELLEERRKAFRSVQPGQIAYFPFRGLADVAEEGVPLTLSFQPNAEGNRPDVFYDLTVVTPTGFQRVMEVAPGRKHRVTIPAQFLELVEVPMLDDRGVVIEDAEGEPVTAEDVVLQVGILNGRLVQVGPNQIVPVAQSSLGEPQRVVTFPENGLELSYRVGGYQLNYVRAMLVLWVKLALLAAVAIWASTFLSFPVASLIAFGLFILMEMSGFLASAVEYVGYTDVQGNVQIWKLVTTTTADLVGRVFGIYAALNPTARLVDGRLLPWSSVASGAGVLAAATAGFLGIGVLVMRKRELALYSGN